MLWNLRLNLHCVLGEITAELEDGNLNFNGTIKDLAVAEDKLLVATFSYINRDTDVLFYQLNQ